MQKSKKCLSTFSATKNVPAKYRELRQNAPLKTQNVPAKTQNVPAKSQNVPAKIKNVPVKTKTMPAKHSKLGNFLKCA